MANKGMGTEEGTAAVSGSAIQKSFTRATKELTALLRSNDAIYQIPWFGMIGEADSGKDLLLPSTGITARPGCPNNFGLEEDQATFWWFFDNAVVIDFASAYFAQKGGPGKAKKGLLKRIFGSNKARGAWAEALRALQMNRPRRPLDGMIIAINVNDLKARTPEQTSALHRKAEAMADRLRETQYELGVHVPVYIVLTGCESITGFQAFGQAVPPAARQQIFGWSCPYQPDEVYQNDWIDEAIGSLHESTGTLQLDLLASITDQDERDALYLLPREINALREPLKMFLEPMFKGTSYRKALPLRGIYLTGKLPVPKSQDPKAPPPAADAPIELGPPAFTKQLFSEKIFQEPGLATLDEARMKALNKTVRLWKILSAAGVILSLLMFWWQSSSTDSKVESFDTALQLMKAHNEAHHYGTSLQLSGDSGSQVLESLVEISMEKFELYTVPTSFAQPITETSEVAVARLLEENVGGSLQNALNLIASKVLPPDMDVRLTEPGMPMKPYDRPDDPLALPKLDSLDLGKHLESVREFAKWFEELYINFMRYEQHSPADLGELYFYLTQKDIREQLNEKAERYRSILEALEKWPRINDEQYRVRAQARVYQYLDRLAKEVFAAYPLVSYVAALDVKLRNLKSIKNLGEGSRSAEFQALLDLRSDLQKIKNELEGDKANWIAASQYEPDEGFIKLVEILNGDAFSKDLNKKMGDQFAELFKKKYAGLHDEIFGYNILRVSNGQIVFEDKIKALDKAIDEFLDLKFIIQNDKQFEESLHDNAGLREEWSNKLDGQLVSWSKDLDSYVSVNHANLPEGAHDVLLKAARKQFQILVKKVMNEYASPANIGNSGADSQSASSQNRDLLKRRIANVASEWDSIMQINLALYNVNHVLNESSTKSANDAEIARLLRSDATNLINQVSMVLQNEKLYTIRSDSFTWGDTEITPNVIAFGARDGNDLTARLESQRQTITTLAKDFAQPLVEKMLQAGDEFAKNEKVNEWNQIIEIVNEYERKVPGNPLEDLERFIEEDLSKLIQLDRCSILLKDAKSNTKGDFFSKKKQSIAKAMDARCKDNLETATMRAYVSLQSLFTERLAGRFPFAAPDTAMDVEAKDIVEFYKMYDIHADELKTVKANSALFGESETPNIVRFIRTIDRSRELFASMLTSEEEDPDLIIDASFAFRVNTESEVNGNQIIEWYAEVSNEKIGHRSNKQNTQWKSNDPIKMCFRWAEQAMFQPASDQKTEYASVNGKTICYNFSGRWALLRMLTQHATTAVDRGRRSSLRPHTLRFETETTVSAQSSGTNLMANDTRVYVRVGLMLPGAKSAYTLPELPRSAPEVKKAILKQKGLNSTTSD